MLANLSISEAEEVREWLEDQQEMTPKFLASFKLGQADLTAVGLRHVEP